MDCSNQKASTNDIVYPKLNLPLRDHFNATTLQNDDPDVPKSTEEQKNDLPTKEKKDKTAKPSKRMTAVRIGAIRATQNLSQQVSAYFVPENVSRRHRPPRSRKGPLTPTYSKAS